MGLFSKKKDAAVNNKLDSKQTNIKQNDCAEKDGYYQTYMQTLNDNIKDFSFDLEDLNADNFKGHLDELLSTFILEQNEKKQDEVFKRYDKVIKAYIGRKKRYFNEKEDEFKNIVKLLTEGITYFNDGNQEFNNNINKHSSKLLEIDKLDNIKTIKKVLKDEVEQIKTTVKEKADKDAKRIKKLSQEVKVLREDLAKAETASFTDKLTGAFNRHAFDLHMKKRIDTFGLVLSTFAVMMIDIDNFKLVNDTYGHLEGDKVIAETVKSARSFLRQHDFIARYGGEEFVIVLDGSSLKNGIIKAEKIREAIEKLSLVLNRDKFEENFKFTISIGVSAMHDGDTGETILERADKALYQAKRSGKNKVVHELDLKND